MADTTPKNDFGKEIEYVKTPEEINDHVVKLENEINILNSQIAVKQKVLVRIYRIFGEDMHACKLDLNTEGRMAWMQELARVASIKVVNVDTAVDKAVEATNVEPLKVKKPAKIVGVGVAGEKSGH